MSNKTATLILVAVPCFVAAYFLWAKYHLASYGPAANSDGLFSYSFSEDATLEESGAPEESSSPYWWVDSGGQLIQKDGVGMTIQGSLDDSSPWFSRYRANNPVDTDNGTHPQNIFRLVTKNSWRNFTEECYYMVTDSNFSASPNRNESNGLLLFNRYLDGDNLYYAGLRVDGQVTIKKKYKGTYYTMTLLPTLGGGLYNRMSNPNLIPMNIWIGLRSIVKDNPDGSVDITLYMNQAHGDWQLVAHAVDDGKQYGGPVIRGPGRAGIRTDFMDVKLDDYKIEELK